MDQDTIATFTYDDAPISTEQWQEWLDAGKEALRFRFIRSVGRMMSTYGIDDLNDLVDDLVGCMCLVDLSYEVDRAATAELWATYPAYTDADFDSAQLVIVVEGTIEWDHLIDTLGLADPEA